MSGKKINLEEIMQDYVDPHCFLKTKCYEHVIEAMKETIRQVLELAAERAKIVPCNCPIEGKTSIEMSLKDGRYVIVDKQSILNTINQIE